MVLGHVSIQDPSKPEVSVLRYASASIPYNHFHGMEPVLTMAQVEVNLQGGLNRRGGDPSVIRPKATGSSYSIISHLESDVLWLALLFW